MERARLRPLLLGRDSRESLLVVAAGVVLGAVAFAVTWARMDGVFTAVGNLSLPLLAVLLALAAWTAYRNEGILAASFLVTAPTYAFLVHLFHVGWTGRNPYPEAAVSALWFALGFGVAVGVLGSAAGLAARRVDGQRLADRLAALDD